MNYTFRLIWEFLLRFRGVIAIGIVVGIAFFLGLRFLTPLTFERQADRVGMTGKYTPDNLPSAVLADIGDGLTKIGKDGSVSTALAVSWEAAESGRVWTFHLAKNRKWQDGTKVTSDTVKYNFQDVEIKAIDPYTIRFNLKAPFAPFPIVVSRPAFKKGLLGTGKLRVSNLSLVGGFAEKLVLDDTKGSQKIYKFYPTEERTKLAYKLGEVSKLSDLIDPKPFDSWPNTKVGQEINQNRFVAVFFNTQDKALANKSVRQALNYAIDKSRLGKDRAFGPVSPDSWAYNPQVKAYDYDKKRAKEIIDGLSKEEKSSLALTLSTPSVLLDEAEKIQKDWQAIGVKTNIQVVPVKPDNYQAYLIIHDIPSDPDQYTMWHSTQEATNLAKYKSPRIDKLLEDGRTELNSDNRKKIYLDFQRFLLEDAPAAFLYHPISYTVSRK